MARVIQRELHAKGPIKLLDVGCGEGKLILYAHSPAIEFTGLDVFVHCHIETARSNGYQQLVHHDVRDGLPFAHETFDIVVCSHVLEHLISPEQLVVEAQRVLRPGGLLIVGVPMHTRLIQLLRIHLAPIFMPRKRRDILMAEWGHVQFFTMRELMAVLSAFEIEDVRGFYFLSARALPMEDWRWWFNINSWWGRSFPNLTAEVNVAARKPGPYAVACSHVWNGHASRCRRALCWNSVWRGLR